MNVAVCSTSVDVWQWRPGAATFLPILDGPNVARLPVHTCSPAQLVGHRARRRPTRPATDLVVHGREPRHLRSRMRVRRTPPGVAPEWLYRGLGSDPDNPRACRPSHYCPTRQRQPGLARSSTGGRRICRDGHHHSAVGARVPLRTVGVRARLLRVLPVVRQRAQRRREMPNVHPPTHYRD